jgi:hypothetical protein
MMKSKQFIEAVKTAVIVFLFASAVFLGGKSGVFSEFLSSVPVFASTGDWISSLLHHRENREEPFKDSLQLQQAAYPSGIVLTFDDSGHYGVKYDNTRLTELYGKVSNLLGESLGSASVPAEINEQQWRAALNSPGIFLEFHTDIPLSVLVRWLGQNIRNENIHSTRRICLALAQGEENSVELFYIGSGGKFYRCRTAAKLNSVLTSLEAYTPNGAEYAYEYRTDLKMLDPYTVLLRESPEKLLINAKPSLCVAPWSRFSPPFHSTLNRLTFMIPKNARFNVLRDSREAENYSQEPDSVQPSGTKAFKDLYVGAQPETGDDE